MTLTGLWLPNATMHPLPDRPGRAYRDTREKKMLLHTTEGSTIGGAINAYKRYPPHLIYDWGTRELRQHIRLDFAAYALRSTDAENDGTVQVELVGFAAETPTWPPYALQRIAEDVLAPVHRLWPYELQAPLYDDQDAYGTDGSTRMTWAEFDAYSGLVGHQHSPGDCVTADTPVLCADLTWQPAGDLLPGDELIAFQAESSEQVGRRLMRSTVLHNSTDRDALLAVNTRYGTVRCTYNHPWLVRRGDRQKWGSWQWVEARDLQPGDEAMRVIDPWKTDRSWESGWLAGMLDGEGSLSHADGKGSVLNCTQRVSPTADMMVEVFKQYTDRTSVFTRDRRNHQHHDVVIVNINSKAEAMRVLGQVRPPRLLAKADVLWEGGTLGRMGSRVEIDSIEPHGTGTIARLTTSSGTYIADGWAHHNTHWDPGKINIDQLLGFLRQELGDDMSYGSDKLADLWNGAYAQLQKEFPSDRPADWGYSIQQTNGQILNWVTPTLGRVEKTVGSIKSMVEGIAAGVARIEQKLDAFGSGGGSAPSGPVQLTDADLAAIQAVVLEALRR